MKYPSFSAFRKHKLFSCGGNALKVSLLFGNVPGNCLLVGPAGWLIEIVQFNKTGEQGVIRLKKQFLSTF